MARRGSVTAPVFTPRLSPNGSTLPGSLTAWLQIWNGGEPPSMPPRVATSGKWTAFIQAGQRWWTGGSQRCWWTWANWDSPHQPPGLTSPCGPPHNTVSKLWTGEDPLGRRRRGSVPLEESALLWSCSRGSTEAAEGKALLSGFAWRGKTQAQARSDYGPRAHMLPAELFCSSPPNTKKLYECLVNHKRVEYHIFFRVLRVITIKKRNAVVFLRHIIFHWNTFVLFQLTLKHMFSTYTNTYFFFFNEVIAKAPISLLLLRSSLLN